MSSLLISHIEKKKAHKKAHKKPKWDRNHFLGIKNKRDVIKAGPPDQRQDAGEEESEDGFALAAL